MLKIRRLLLDELLKWKHKENRKPLLLKGVRQCGKTWLLKEFGKNHYEDTAYYNFEGNTALWQRFEQDLDVNRLIIELGVLRGKALHPGHTLIIFDEIQFCNRALTALKYFCENAPEYHIASAGSLLGVALSKPLSFPVGKVDMLTLRPLCFYEFLLANNQELLCQYLATLNAGEKIPAMFSDRLINCLKTYYITGGMPEAVAAWIKYEDIAIVDEVQQKLIDSYELDFAKHAPAGDFPKISMIWNAIPGQLAKENSKFIFSHVKQGYRSKDLEDALEWLIGSGLAYKVKKIEKPFMPISAYAVETYFKLYMADIGILRKMSRLPAQAVFEGLNTYREFKGAMAENFVLTELVHICEDIPYFWRSNNSAEVDFVVQQAMDIVPIEVKSEHANRTRSLTEYRSKYKPRISVITSMDNVGGAEVKHIPLYMLWNLKMYIGG